MNKSARLLMAGAICVLMVVYVAALVTGHISDKAKIDLSTVAVVLICLCGIFALVTPGMLPAFKEFLSRVTSVEIASMKVQVADIRAKQLDQSATLELISLILPLVLGDRERKHLVNLYRKRTKDYVGNHDLRAELRRLRYLTLIVNPGAPIGSAKDASTFDLAELVQLTSFGRKWARQIDDMEKLEQPPGEQ
ncbi:MAG TPA: hypothetical protein VN710_12700 [Verrucomicrobiae bacterium]|nr:hypothetical protein [Verrucomicrobiae bacterium]